MTTRPELAGDFGMVASTHWLASQVGMAILERGGNAADAAVAAGFVLQVVEPHLNGPAGEVPILVADPDGTTHVICGQGAAPAAATPEVFADLGLDQVPGTGLLAATVPGSFGAWLLLLRRWGTMRLREVLEPAIGYALDGAPVLPRVSSTIAELADLYRTGWPTSAEVYLPHGEVPAPWARLRLTALGRTYQRLLAEAEAAGADRDAQIEAARAAWYSGFVAEEIDRFCAGPGWPDTSGEPHAGLLTGQDLAGWQATVEQPATATYRGAEVCKPGPWSAGPVLLQQLRLLEGLDLGDLAPDDPQWVHLVVEAQKLAYADREAWYGDPDVVDVPLADLLGDEYTVARRAGIHPETADLRLRPGSPGGRPPVLPALAEFGPDGVPVPGTDPVAEDPVDGTPLRTLAPAGVGEPTMAGTAPGPAPDPAPNPAPNQGLGAARGDTCHVDVVDRWGGMVSATPSGAWLQSSPVVPALGFPLGTRAQMFRLEPGLPSTLRPGTRPRTTLSPTLVRRDGAGWLALGTPGGDQQDQWSLLLLLRILHAPDGAPLALQAAIDAPAFHTEHTPSSFYPRQSAPGRVVVEQRWPDRVTADLIRRGHRVVEAGGWTLGRLSAVAREPGGWLRGAANSRGAQGYAVGR